ncbi:hypothetical protein KKI24_17905 [bacterium]|nr:hypothetical protein [bacterium]
MSENQAVIDGPEQKQKKDVPVSANSADARLIEDIKLALELPLPGRDVFWQLGEGQTQKSRSRILAFFKKKDLSDDELSDLRQEADNTPGRARVKIQMLRKKYAENTSLIMLSAFCTYRMVANSSNRRHMLEGLKSASRDAAYALTNDGISLYNCEIFFLIYFEYLAKFKRFQIATYKTVREWKGYESAKKQLAIALKICDGLLDELHRATRVLNQVKGKFKSSSYILPWEFADIQMAGKKVEQTEYKVICGPAEARETLVYTLAMTDIFARIPILFPLVDTILNLVPESTNSLFLRKSAIQSTRAFTQLNIASQEGNMERIRALGLNIFKNSNENIKRIANQPIKQPFEAEHYFFLSRVAIMTFGTYSAKEQKVMLLASLKAMQRVIKLDMTKNHVFTESAQTMAQKINNLLSS